MCLHIDTISLERRYVQDDNARGSATWTDHMMRAIAS